MPLIHSVVDIYQEITSSDLSPGTLGPTTRIGTLLIPSRIDSTQTEYDVTSSNRDILMP